MKRKVEPKTKLKMKSEAKSEINMIQWPQSLEPKAHEYTPQDSTIDCMAIETYSMARMYKTTKLL